MPAHLQRSAPALPPKVIGFRVGLDATAKIDAAKGTMSGIAVVTGNLQPRGWPMWVDAKSLATFQTAFAALGATKSYITHDGAAYADRLTEEIGLFSNFRLDGETCRADFAALDAFRKHDAEEFDHLFELAAKAPASFGVSPVFTCSLVWVRQNGEEVPTEVASYCWDAECCDYLPVFSPAIPADSKTPLPCVRVSEAMSVDFTDAPATNPGLFSARPEVDAAGKGNPSPIPLSNSPAMSLHSQLFAKFRSSPAQFARAVELHEGDAKQSFESIVATVEREGTTAQIATLRADLDKSNGELATLREAATKHADTLAAKDKEIAGLKTQLAGFTKGPAAGAPAVPTGEPGSEAPTGVKKLSRAEFKKLTPAARGAFSAEVAQGKALLTD